METADSLGMAFGLLSESWEGIQKTACYRETRAVDDDESSVSSSSSDEPVPETRKSKTL